MRQVAMEVLQIHRQKVPHYIPDMAAKEPLLTRAPVAVLELFV